MVVECWGPVQRSEQQPQQLIALFERAHLFTAAAEAAATATNTPLQLQPSTAAHAISRSLPRSGMV